MKHLRWWILAAGLGTFAAGMSVGIAIPRVAAACDDPAGPRQAELEYARNLSRTYELSSKQQRSLGMVLQSSSREEAAVRAEVEYSQLPAEVQRRLLLVRSRTEKRIRALLDDDQRARYDRDREGRAAGAPADDK